MFRGEEHRQHRSNAVDADGDLGVLGSAAKPVLEEDGVDLQPLVGDIVEEIEGGDAGGHRQRVAGQGAGLVDGALGRHHLHDVAAAAVGAHGQAAADDLAQTGDVRLDAEHGLGTAEAEAEAGDHLVEDQERPVI